jgi:hypothetical protein
MDCKRSRRARTSNWAAESERGQGGCHCTSIEESFSSRCSCLVDVVMSKYGTDWDALFSISALETQREARWGGVWGSGYSEWEIREVSLA